MPSWKERGISKAQDQNMSNFRLALDVELTFGDSQIKINLQQLHMRWCGRFANLNLLPNLDCYCPPCDPQQSTQPTEHPQTLNPNFGSAPEHETRCFSYERVAPNKYIIFTDNTILSVHAPPRSINLLPASHQNIERFIFRI